MNNVAVSANQNVSVSEIAKLAGVRPSAVSNWRSRHPDFPLPVDSSATAELFDLKSVIEWLEAHSKPFTLAGPSVDKALWALADYLRGAATMQDIVVLVLQVVYIRTCATVSDASIQPAWATLKASSRPVEDWSRIVSGLAHVRPELERVLALPPSVGERELRTAIDTLGGITADQEAWGAIATAFLRRFHEALGVWGGEFATSESVADLLISLLEPLHGVLYDPAAGLGMVLAQAWQNRATSDLRLVGQEISELNWRLGYLNLAINGAQFDLAIGDTLRADAFRSLRADRIIADPPLGARADGTAAYHDERWQFGFPRSSSEWLWAQQVIFHMAEDATGVMVVPLAALSRTGADAMIRRHIIEANLLDAVIELPPGMMAGTATSAALLVFAYGRKGREERVLFIDARQLGAARRGKSREFSTGDVERILSIVRAWRNGKFVEEPRFAAAATVAKIVAGAVDISPSRYVKYEAAEVTSIDGEPVQTRLERLKFDFDSAAKHLSMAARHVHTSAAAFIPRQGSDVRTVRLSDLLETAPRTGVRQETEKDGPAIPYISTRLVTSGSGHLDAVPTEVTRGAIRDRAVQRYDVLLASRGIDSNGRIGCAVVNFNEQAAYAESLMRLRLDRSRVEPDYLRLFFTSRQGRATLAAVTTGSVIANLRPDALGEVKVPLPPMSEQRAIVNEMLQIEHSVAEFANVLDLSRDLFDTLRESIASGLYTPSHRDQ